MTITEHLESKGIGYTKNAETKKLSSIRAGGRAKLLVYPKSTAELIYLLELMKTDGGKYKIIGNLTNVFFSDDGYEGTLICTKLMSKMIPGSDELSVKAQAGASLSKILLFGAGAGIDLSCALFGIPGTLGGALFNNAGAFGSEISSSFISGEFFDLDCMKIIHIASDEMDFSYRNSLMQRERLVFLEGTLSGYHRDGDSIISDLMRYKSKRLAKHPQEPSLGSFFKKGKSYSASKLIDDAGLKGYSIGGASVSEKHAGFLINKGGATASEINELANFIEDTVYDKYSVKLHREAEFVK